MTESAAAAAAAAIEAEAAAAATDTHLYQCRECGVVSFGKTALQAIKQAGHDEDCHQALLLAVEDAVSADL